MCVERRGGDGMEEGGRGGEGAALQGAQAFVFLAHLRWGEKGGEARAREHRRDCGRGSAIKERVAGRSHPRRHDEPLWVDGDVKTKNKLSDCRRAPAKGQSNSRD